MVETILSLAHKHLRGYKTYLCDIFHENRPLDSQVFGNLVSTGREWV